MYFIDHWYPPTQMNVTTKQQEKDNTTKQPENAANTPAVNQTFDFVTPTVIPHSDKQSAASMIA
eukprot:UN02311